MSLFVSPSVCDGNVCNTLNIFSVVCLHLLELMDKSLHL